MTRRVTWCDMMSSRAGHSMMTNIGQQPRIPRVFEGFMRHPQVIFQAVAIAQVRPDHFSKTRRPSSLGAQGLIVIVLGQSSRLFFCSVWARL